LLNPEQTLFIDDTPANSGAANKPGMETFHFIRDQFKDSDIQRYSQEHPYQLGWPELLDELSKTCTGPVR
jgi:FMN phosphatase YigB (HAD superfamily)